MSRAHGWARGNYRELLAWAAAVTVRDYDLARSLGHHHGMCLDRLGHHGSCRRGPLLARGGLRAPLVSCGLLRRLYRPRSEQSALVCVVWAIGVGSEAACLLLYQFQFLRLEQLLGYALRASLGTETEIPQLLAERRRVFVEEAGQLNLKGLDVGLSMKSNISTWVDRAGRSQD